MYLDIHIDLLFKYFIFHQKTLSIHKSFKKAYVIHKNTNKLLKTTNTPQKFLDI